MKRNSILSFGGIILISCLLLLASNKKADYNNFEELAKIGLRNLGHQLLLLDNDSTSLVLPVVKIEDAVYKLSFQNSLSITPEVFVGIAKTSFEDAGLPNIYRVEILQTTTNDVAYSYEIRNGDETDVIPCMGRDLPKGNYDIKVRFTSIDSSNSNESTLMYISIVGLFGFLMFTYFKSDKQIKGNVLGQDLLTIGSFKFNPNQNKLYNDDQVFNLSKKECEILAILVRHKNLIVSREDLNKEVWEDKGVIVGRSLDTYISKLRKKLSTSKDVNINNIHGIGYKLEITEYD